MKSITAVQKSIIEKSSKIDDAKKIIMEENRDGFKYILHIKDIKLT